MPEKDRITLWTGLLLIVAAVITLYLLEPVFFMITEIVESSITSTNSGLLILAAGLYSLTKTIAALPLLLGSYFISSGLVKKFCVNHRYRRAISFGVNLAAAAAIYFLVFGLTRYHPDPFIPLIVVGFVLLMAKPQHKRLRLVHQATITTQLLLGCYWLDVSPFLDIFGLGKDEIAVSIKLTASYLQSASVMNFISFSFFIPLVLIAIITSVLINNYYKQVKHIEAAKQKEKELQRYRLQSVQARSLKEMHSLVHDLKTPLMTINGLCSLLEMKYQPDAKDREYFWRIDRSVENMNEMISEILYETTKRKIAVSDLVNYVRAQLIPEKVEQEINFSIEEDLPLIKVNRVRLARAIINLLENALEATKDMANGRIDINVYREEGGVWITISDNGIGIPRENLYKIWKTGFSTGNTSGLGLPFVRKVIEDHGGTIEVSSEVGVGTTFKIYLRGEDD